MARNKKPRNKKYSGPTLDESNNLEPTSVINQANLSPEQIQQEEVLFSLWIGRISWRALTYE